MSVVVDRAREGDMDCIRLVWASAMPRLLEAELEQQGQEITAAELETTFRRLEETATLEEWDEMEARGREGARQARAGLRGSEYHLG